MGSLTGQTPASDYGGLLNVNAGSIVGLTNVLQQVTDGYGSPTPLQLSTIALNIIRSGYTFQLDGVAVTAQAVDINSMCQPNPVALGTGSFTSPVGTTAERPSVPVAGMERFNTDTNAFEGYDGSNWVAFSAGGTVVSVTGTANEITISGTASNPIVGLASNLIFPGTAALDNGNDLAFFDSTGVGFAAFKAPTANYSANATYELPVQAPAFNGYVLSATTAGVMSWIDVTTGSVTSVSGTLNRITSTGGQAPVIDIAATYVGQTSLTTLGTITTGVWNASVINVPYGGTGAASFTPYAVICGGITGTSQLQSVASVGTAGQALISNGAGTLPTWQDIVSGVGTVTGTLNRITASPTTGNVVVDISASYVGQASITTLGTIGTGVWQGTVVDPTYGGTGVNNGANTLTLAGSLATVGNFGVTFNFTGATNVTFPTSGTLLTSAGAVTSIAGTSNQIVASASTGSVTLSLASNAVMPGTGGLTLPTGTTAQQAGPAGTIRFNSETSVFEVTTDGVAWSALSTASGTVVSVSGTANRITSTGGTTPVIDIAATYVGQSSITTVGALASGSLAAGFTPVTVPIGGTGATSFTAYSVICGGTTSTGALQNVSGVGTTGQVLTSNGAAALPTWQTISIPSAGAVTLAVTQANSFAGGEWVYLNGATYTAASNASAVTAEVVGVVAHSPAPTGTTFTLQTNGILTGETGRTSGDVYFLDTAGALTTTPPTAANTVVKPLMVGNSTTSGIMINFRGEINEPPSFPYDLAFIAGYSTTGTNANVAVQNYGQLVMARTGSFTGDVGYANTAPTGSAMILDVLKNGTTIYTVKPQFAASANTMTSGTLKTDGTEDFVSGDVITFTITQIGSSTAGQGVKFTLTGVI